MINSGQSHATASVCWAFCSKNHTLGGLNRTFLSRSAGCSNSKMQGQQGWFLLRTDPSGLSSGFRWFPSSLGSPGLVKHHPDLRLRVRMCACLWASVSYPPSPSRWVETPRGGKPLGAVPSSHVGGAQENRSYIPRAFLGRKAAGLGSACV